MSIMALDLRKCFLFLYGRWGRDADMMHDRKKQFLRRISEWGFQKNVKWGERRAILKGIGGAITEGRFEARILRGRKLDKAKLERWRKREGLSSEGTEAGSAHHPGKLEGQHRVNKLNTDKE